MISSKTADFFVIANVFLGSVHCTAAWVHSLRRRDIGAGRSAPYGQTVRSLLRTPGCQSRLEKFDKKRVPWIHFNGKIALNYFWSNVFGKVKYLTNLPTTFIVTVKSSTTYDGTHSAKSKFWLTFLMPSLSLLTVELLMMERIRQSQKFDKPSYYLHCHCKKVNYFWSNRFGKVKNFDKPSYYLHCHCKKFNYF